jgi:hypothetical protein
LVWREQGLGDELLFLTCLGDLVGAGAVVTVVVSPRLVSLVARAFPTVRVVGDEPGAIGVAEGFDWHLPLGSLPRWFRRERPAFEGRGRYLTALGSARATWRARLAGLPAGKRVGVCWRTGLRTGVRARHYAPLAAWGPVWAVPGVVWVNLQYDECEAELSAVEREAGVVVQRWAGVDLKSDLESVVGLVAELDAVVTAPTAVSSVAGAVGVRSWEVDSGSDWTALGERVSPWFPSLTVVRKGPGGWEAALATVAEALRHWAQSETPR